MQEHLSRWIGDQAVESVVKALRRVNFQGSIFGQSVALRLGLSESDIDALELLLDTGASTAGKLAEVLGMTTGAVTRVIDRLEQAGYVRRTTDPADRRRVIIEAVPERAQTLEAMLGALERAAQDEVGQYSPEQLALISEFLGRMADLTQTEAARLRTTGDDIRRSPAVRRSTRRRWAASAEARLTFRAGVQDLRIRTGRDTPDLYRGRFDGATPQVRVRDGRVLVQYRGIPFDWRKRTATIALNPAIPWTVEVQGGVNRLEADLRDLDLRRFELTGGSERFQLELGRPVGQVPVRLVGGSRTVRIERPRGVPAAIHLQGGVNLLEIDGRVLGQKGGDLRFSAGQPEGAANRFDIEIVGGTRAVTVVEQA